VDKSSTIVTSCPSAINEAARFDPIKPAPPVMVTFFFTVILYRISNKEKEKLDGF